jgi:hypothetical protein
MKPGRFLEAIVWAHNEKSHLRGGFLLSSPQTQNAALAADPRAR